MHNDVLLATDHLAVTSFASPNTAARAHVYIMNTLGAQFVGATDVVDVIRVAAVDDHVTGSYNRNELLEHRVNQCRRDHQPDRAGWLEFRDKGVERCVAGC